MTANAPRRVSPPRLRLGVCLSLSGRHARFGKQVAAALDLWRLWDGAAELIIEDDRSDPRELATAMRRVATSCDVLLGPYSTQLMRTAGKVAADLDCLIWNHGGSGDDVQAAHPGRIVSVLTPTSRYAEPFLRHIARDSEPGRLWLVHGQGSFGRQVAEGAEATARALGIQTAHLGPDDELPRVDSLSSWHLFCAASFEEDVETVKRAQRLPKVPQTLCAVAAGVREFGEAVEHAEGIYGVGQWFPGSGHNVEVGPAEADFVMAYQNRARVLPDYPAVQAAATAVIATHCTRLAGGTTRELLWATVSMLDTTTLFGAFRIDSRSGVQVGHEAVLTRWTRNGPTVV